MERNSSQYVIQFILIIKLRNLRASIPHLFLLKLIFIPFHPLGRDASLQPAPVEEMAGLYITNDVTETFSH